MLSNSDSTEKEKQRLSETTAASGIALERYLGSATPIGADTVGLHCMMAISTVIFFGVIGWFQLHLLRKDGQLADITSHLTGFIRIEAGSLAAAALLLAGNPVYEAGGTVEIRELPVTD